MRRHVFLLLSLGTFAAAMVVPSTPAAAAEQPYFAAQRAGDRPPMGWNSWNKFACDINEQRVRDAADTLVSSGMRDAGYQYVNVDDCWAEQNRTADGKLEANHVKFPSGIKALADYMHERGLKLGIYTSAGTQTCQKTMPGGLDHEEVDAQTFADWGVDYLKYDNCNNEGRPAIERYTKMGDAIKKTGRPMIYALCEWGENKPWLWGRESGAQLWRTTGDISDSWGSMTGILDQQVGLEKYSGPGGWNDPDMLEVGNGGMTDTEYRSHFALWALLNAPLLAGNDLSTMSAATKSILENKDIIALDQDWAGIQGHKIRDDGDTEVWAKPMSDGSTAVVLLNRGDAATNISAKATEVGAKASKSYRVRDLWSGAETESAGSLNVWVPRHGSAVYRVWPARFPNAAPLTTFALQAPEYATTSKPFTATLRLTNSGSTPLAAGLVKLGVPAGWKADGRPEAVVPLVLPGKSWEHSWTVKPVSPTGDHVTVTGNAEYWTAWGQRKLTTDNSALVVKAPSPGANPLSKAPFLSSENGWGPVERGMSNGETEAGDGKPITIGGVTYADGLGVHATSKIRFYVGGGCTSFSSFVGHDDEQSTGSVAFQVLGDGKELAKTDVLKAGQPAQHLTAALTGVQVLDLILTDGGDGSTSDHADWADATITC